MTIYELSNQLCSIAVDHQFNGKKRSEKWLRTYIQSMFRAGGDNIIMEIVIPDGCWLFEVHQWTENGRFQYDYAIPDTRAHESRLYERLGITSPYLPHKQ